MNPWMLLPVIVILPFMVAATLLVPLYLAMSAACYLIYVQTNEQAPILANFANPDYMLSSYLRLLTYWQSHMTELSFIHYTLPLIVLPLIILGLALWLSYRFLNAIKDILHLS